MRRGILSHNDRLLMPTQDKTKQDIQGAIDRRSQEHILNRAGLSSNEREHVIRGLSKLQQALDLDTTVSVEVVTQQLVRTLPSAALDYLKGPLTEAKWYIYDRTGKELPMRRLHN